MAMRRECKKDPKAGITRVDLYDGERRIFGISIADKFISQLPPEQIHEQFWQGCLDIAKKEGENADSLVRIDKVLLVSDEKNFSGTTLDFENDGKPVHCHYHGGIIPQNIAALQQSCGAGIAKAMKLNRECW